MPEPKSDHAAVMRFLAFLALAVGAVAMLTSGQPNSEAAIAFGGGCAMVAVALLVLESVLAY
jgi:hypothetical protein